MPPTAAITIVGPGHGASRQPYVPGGRGAVGRSADSPETGYDTPTAVADLVAAAPALRVVRLV
ncbi:hypothetical protein ABZ390_09870, partial [Streptomyces solisilvae]